MQKGWLARGILLVMAAALCVLPALYLAMMAAGRVTDGPAASASNGYSGGSSGTADMPGAALKAKIVALRDQRLLAERNAGLNIEQNEPAADEDEVPMPKDECPPKSVAATIREPAMPLMGRAAAVACHDAYQKMKSSCNESAACSDCKAAFAQYSDACSRLQGQ